MSTIYEDLVTLFNLERDAVMTNSPILLAKLTEQQEAMRIYGVQIIPAGLELLRQNLLMAGNKEPERLERSIEEIDWVNWKSPEDLLLSNFIKSKNSGEEFHPQSHERSEIFGLNFHFWMQSLIVPIKFLGKGAETYLMELLVSPDYQISCLSCKLASFGDFTHLKVEDKLLHVVRTSNYTAQKLLFARSLFTKGNEVEFKKLVVPFIIPNDMLFDKITKDEDKRRRNDLFAFVNDVVLWDIATNGRGPVKRWPLWWKS